MRVVLWCQFLVIFFIPNFCEVKVHSFFFFGHWCKEVTFIPFIFIDRYRLDWVCWCHAFTRNAVIVILSHLHHFILSLYILRTALASMVQWSYDGGLFLVINHSYILVSSSSIFFSAMLVDLHFLISSGYFSRGLQLIRIYFSQDVDRFPH